MISKRCVGIWLLGLCGTAHAAPTINQVSGPLQHGKALTLTGAQFGTKVPAAPFRFDNFEQGTAGQTITAPWATHVAGGTGAVPAAYSTAQNRSGSQRSVVTTFGGGVYRNDFGEDQKSGQEFKRLYISFQAYVDLSGELSRNFKIFRAYSAAPDDHSQLTISTFPDQSGPSFIAATEQQTSWGVMPLNENTWQRYAAYADFGTSGSLLRIWFQGKKTLDATHPADSTGYGGDELRIGHYYAQDKKICTDAGGAHYLEPCDQVACADGSWSASCYSNFCQGTCAFTDLGCSSKGGCNAKIYFDDVYIDVTQARVELCQHPTWSQIITGGGHCELQIPSAWSASSVQVTANRGTFTNGQTAYLYVVDATGTANASGFLVTVGGTAPADSGVPKDSGQLADNSLPVDSSVPWEAGAVVDGAPAAADRGALDGSTTDAGSTSGRPTEDGCSCEAGPGAGGGWWIVILLLLGRRSWSHRMGWLCRGNSTARREVARASVLSTSPWALDRRPGSIVECRLDHGRATHQAEQAGQPTGRDHRAGGAGIRERHRGCHLVQAV